MFVFFFSSRRRHTRWPRDWSSDVCSSDLSPLARPRARARGVPRLAPAGPCSRSSEGRSSGSLLVLLREDGVDLLVELLRPLLHAQLTSEDLGDHVALDLQPEIGRASCRGRVDIALWRA